MAGSEWGFDKLNLCGAWASKVLARRVEVWTRAREEEDEKTEGIAPAFRIAAPEDHRLDDTVREQTRTAVASALGGAFALAPPFLAALANPGDQQRDPVDKSVGAKDDHESSEGDAGQKDRNHSREDGQKPAESQKPVEAPRPGDIEGELAPPQQAAE